MRVNHLMSLTVWIIATIVGAIFVKSIFFPSITTVEIQSGGKTQEPILEGRFTPKTLYKHNGFDTENIYIAVKGNVYDVSKSRQFYGPSGPYSNFAGHDASRGLALNSFELDVIRGIGDPVDDLSGLTQQDLKSLDGWEETFQSKYPKVGVLVDE